MAAEIEEIVVGTDIPAQQRRPDADEVGDPRIRFVAWRRCKRGAAGIAECGSGNALRSSVPSAARGSESSATKWRGTM